MPATTDTIRCPQCHIEVARDQLKLPNRCHSRCPLNPYAYMDLMPQFASSCHPQTDERIHG